MFSLLLDRLRSEREQENVYRRHKRFDFEDVDDFDEAVEKSFVEESIVEDSMIENSVVEKSFAEDSIVKDPVIENSFEKSILENSLTENSIDYFKTEADLYNSNLETIFKNVLGVSKIELTTPVNSMFVFEIFKNFNGGDISEIKQDIYNINNLCLIPNINLLNNNNIFKRYILITIYHSVRFFTSDSKEELEKCAKEKIKAYPKGFRHIIVDIDNLFKKIDDTVNLFKNIKDTVNLLTIEEDYDITKFLLCYKLYLNKEHFVDNFCNFFENYYKALQYCIEHGVNKKFQGYNDQFTKNPNLIFYKLSNCKYKYSICMVHPSENNAIDFGDCSFNAYYFVNGIYNDEVCQKILTGIFTNEPFTLNDMMTFKINVAKCISKEIDHEIRHIRNLNREIENGKFSLVHITIPGYRHIIEGEGKIDHSVKHTLIAIKTEIKDFKNIKNFKNISNIEPFKCIEIPGFKYGNFYLNYSNCYKNNEIVDGWELYDDEYLLFDLNTRNFCFLNKIQNITDLLTNFYTTWIKNKEHTFNIDNIKIPFLEYITPENLINYYSGKELKFNEVSRFKSYTEKIHSFLKNQLDIFKKHYDQKFLNSKLLNHVDIVKYDNINCYRYVIDEDDANDFIINNFDKKFARQQTGGFKFDFSFIFMLFLIIVIIIVVIIVVIILIKRNREKFVKFI